MRPHRVFRIVAIFLCSFVAASSAQAQYTIKKIVFDGTTPYAQADLEAASNLKPGEHLTTAMLQQEAQRLTETGAFGDLEATLDGPFKAITVIFKVKPVDPSRMLDAGFENFIWWPHDELVAEIQHRVPLFNGTLPEAGSLQQSVQEALEQMLSEKQVNAKLSAKVYDAAPGRPHRTIEYRIDSPDIQLHSFKLQGVAAEHAAEVDKITSLLAGGRYNESINGSGITGRVLAVYHNAGYLDASLEDLTRTINTPAPERIDVDLVATIKSGEPYHISKVEWAGSPIISAQDFAASSKLKAGELASQQNLRESLAIIDTAYRGQGYLDVSADAIPQLDPATHLVAYTITAVSGEQYHLHEIQATGLSPESRATLDTAWKLHPGDLYDGNYLDAFLKANVAQPYLQPYSLTYRIVRDPDTHLVTVIFVFAHRPR